MVIMRFREKVGYLTTTRVDEKHSEATITQNISGIRERDKAIAIYQLPEEPQARFGGPGPRKTRVFSASGLWGVIGAVGLLAFLGGGNKQTPGEGATSGVVATSLATTASVPPYSFSVAANMLTWSGVSRGSEELLAYIIYRDGRPMWIVNEREGGGFYFLDPISMETFLGVNLPTDRRVVTATISIDGANGVLTAWTRTVASGLLPTDPTPITNISLDSGEVTLTASFEVPIRPVAGRHHTYTIQRVARYAYLLPANPPSSAVPAYKIKLYSPFSAIAGPATAIVPPVLVSPVANAAALNPSAVEFKFNTSDGADEYVIQVSRDTQFRPENTATTAPMLGLFPGGQAKSQIVDVGSLFPGVGTQVLWWRAGARFIGDQAPPRIQPGWSRTQDAGHVWSEATAFTITTASPMPPMRQGLQQPRKVH